MSAYLGLLAHSSESCFDLCYLHVVRYFVSALFELAGANYMNVLLGNLTQKEGVGFDFESPSSSRGHFGYRVASPHSFADSLAAQNANAGGSEPSAFGARLWAGWGRTAVLYIAFSHI